MWEHIKSLSSNVKVPTIGAAGTSVSVFLAELGERASDIKLGDLCLLASLMVSLATFVWIVLKCFYLVKNKGKGPS